MKYLHLCCCALLISVQLAWAKAPDRHIARTSITVAVIDTGIDTLRATSLGPYLAYNAQEEANLEDEDHNGYADDLLGYDFGQEDTDVSDSQGHGTAVADLLLRHFMENAPQGMQIRILPVKTWSERGKQHTRLSEAILYAVLSGAKVINLSVGRNAQFGTIEHAAIEYAIKQGVVVVAAAGNAPEAEEAWFPAAYPEVCSVTCAMADGTPALYKYHQAIDLGVNTEGMETTYGIPVSGSSFAAPLVSAAAAIVALAYPEWSPMQVVAFLKEQATTPYTSVPANKQGKVGAGILSFAQLRASLSGRFSPEGAFRPLTVSLQHTERLDLAQQRAKMHNQGHWLQDWSYSDMAVARRMEWKLQWKDGKALTAEQWLPIQAPEAEFLPEQRAFVYHYVLEEVSHRLRLYVDLHLPIDPALRGSSMATVRVENRGPQPVDGLTVGYWMDWQLSADWYQPERSVLRWQNNMQVVSAQRMPLSAAAHFFSPEAKQAHFQAVLTGNSSFQLTEELQQHLLQGGIDDNPAGRKGEGADVAGMHALELGSLQPGQQRTSYLLLGAAPSEERLFELMDRVAAWSGVHEAPAGSQPVVTALPTLSADNFKLFPNPSDAQVQVELPPGTWQYLLYSPQGSMVMDGEAQDLLALDLSELPAGVYVFTALQGGKRLQARIVKRP